MTPEPLLYVYAVVRAAPAPPLPADHPGTALGEGLTVVEHEGLTAVAEPVDAGDFGEEPLRTRLEDLDWLARVARAHHGVVGAVARRTTTVPLRLATVCRGEEGVRRLLRNGRDPITAALDRVHGAAEWGVKVYVETEPAAGKGATAPDAGGTPEASGTDGASGRAFLRRRMQERRARQDREGEASRTARHLHDRLASRASAAVLHPPQQARLSRAPGRNVLNAAYLVPDRERETFLEAVPAADDLPQGLRVDVTGPWAPYSFAQAEPGPDRDPDR
ncbi:GvpL/GvpF family gas vesicle protein [Streptomyces tritici]|uniref:GvpL/GvpF family gas vesicle protein n=1 Tax=Streptomyces tritici TaxID=2054410 RepID=UPI003AF1B9C4